MTVKPVSLMRWLCRLVTPPSGTILDPFLGSGTTAMGALDTVGLQSLDERFHFIGIDIDAHYLEVARYRISHRHLLETDPKAPTADREQGRLL